MSPPPLKPDSASEANFQPLSALGDSCSAPILEPDRSALLQEALADSQLQAVKAQLESRGFSINTDEAQAVQLAGGQQLLIPFGEDAHLVWTRANGQTAAVGLIRQGHKTLNVSAEGQERVVRFLSPQKVEKLLTKLRQKPKFQQFEGKLHQRGKRVGKVQALFDETNKIAVLGIAAEGNAEKIAHQVRIKVKADKDDEPEDDAEPAIQATACGQATGEAVPEGAKMQPLALPPGEWGDFEGGYEGPQICTSQWGYDYVCTSRTPAISVSTTSLAVPQTFITQQTQASFVIWNAGGGTLTGTVTTSAPFSIVSGGSFSLSPGQPQEVVVRFSSATPGSFSKSVSISSNGGSKTITVTGVAHKVSFSPATVDFGSGLLVLREQCNQMGTCGLRTEKVGLPIEKTLTVKNEGSVAVTLTLSTAAPYSIVSVLPTLSPGQSAQVTVRFDPNESGSFTGNVQVGINGGQGSVSSPPLLGVAHKIEIDPAELDFGIVIVGNTREQKLTVKNQGVTTVPLAISTEAPFSIASESSFTLTPSESREVIVRLSPTISRDYIRAIQLISNLNIVRVTAHGLAYTWEEYLQALMSIYNVVSQQGQYAVLSRFNETNILTLAGFPELNQPTLQEMEIIAMQAQVDAQNFDPELAQFWDKLLTIDQYEMVYWLGLLAQAIEQGRFEEEYAFLLTQGLGKIQDAFMELVHNPADASQLARDFVYTLAIHGWPSPITAAEQIIDPNENLNRIASLLRNAFWWQRTLEQVFSFMDPLATIVCRANPLCTIPAEIVIQILQEALTQPCGSVNECIDKFIEQTRSVLRMAAERLGSQTAIELAQSIENLMKDYFKAGASPTAAKYWASLWGLIEWMEMAIIDVNQRLERGVGTILVAARMLADGWVNQGFVSKPYSYGTFWASLSYLPETFILPHPVSSPLTTIALVAGGDHCGASCSQKAQEIVAWVEQAIAVAIEYAESLTVENNIHPQAVVSFAFTQRGADVWSVIDALRDAFRDSAVPIIVSWTDQSGQIWYMCIGSASACDYLESTGRAKRIACAQQGKRQCNAIRLSEPRSWGEPPPPPPPGPISITPG